MCYSVQRFSKMCFKNYFRFLVIPEGKFSNDNSIKLIHFFIFNNNNNNNNNASVEDWYFQVRYINGYFS
jgi:hypothetical protein